MLPTSSPPRLLAAVLTAAVLSACTAAPEPPASEALVGTTTPSEVATTPSPTLAPPTASTTPAPPPAAPTSPSPSASEPAPLASAPPAWLGTRVLERDADGFGVVAATPEELVDRRIRTTDLLPPPAGDVFEASVAPVPDDVLARSTWDPACPVTRDELAYVTVSFWGFDGAPHTGELLVHRDVADAVVTAFAALHRERFPIEEMRVVRPDELDAPPTGDGNNTTAFVCRPTRGQTRWSEHAYGRAIDVNPFHNPYVKRGLVLPELASAYTDRAWERPGMVLAEGPVVRAFTAIGWGWGGAWSSLTDPMHLSAGGT